MKILVTGSGGREHALAWKAAQSEKVEKVYVAPGNAGTALEDKLANVELDVMDFEGLAAFATSEAIDLMIVGPEAPLVGGIVDFMEEAGIAAFGPNKSAAQLEGSKHFTKAFLEAHNIPTAAYRSFTDYDQAAAHIRSQNVPLVIKADGLAAGKGVVLPKDVDDAVATAKDMLKGGTFGEAGSRIVVEELLRGEEASFIVIADGEDYLPFASSQDHKPIFEGDQGPNTGGMGAYSPAPVVTEAIHQRICRQVIEPTLAGMKAAGHPYRGFLYAGLMIDQDGTPNVIEFNCRFGDPETQPIMLRMRSDLIDLCVAAMAGQLKGKTIDFDDRHALTVVMASGGYPGNYRKGDLIGGLPEHPEPDEKVFHAGTVLSDGAIHTSGGRVLGVTALADTILAAQTKAYDLVKTIMWQDVYCRQDIGYRAVARESRK